MPATETTMLTGLFDIRVRFPTFGAMPDFRLGSHANFVRVGIERPRTRKVKPRIAPLTEKLLNPFIVREQCAKDELMADPLKSVEQNRHEESDERQKWQ